MELLQKLDKNVRSSPPRTFYIKDEIERFVCQELCVRPTGAFQKCDAPTNTFRFAAKFCYQLLNNYSPDLFQQLTEDPYKWAKRFPKEVCVVTSNFRPRGNFADHKIRGTNYEQDALAVYCQHQCVSVLRRMEVINPTMPFLISGADGAVFADGEFKRIVEIKVPKVARVKGNIRHLLETNQICHDVFMDDDGLQVRGETKFQMQLSMLIYNVDECDLLMYSPVDASLYVKRFYLDPEFEEENLSKIFLHYRVYIPFVYHYMLAEKKQREEEPMEM